MPQEELKYFSNYHQVNIARCVDGRINSTMDFVLDETPVAMVYNGISHAVMLATPNRLEQFGLGFSLTEGIISDKRELHDLEIVESEIGIKLCMDIASERFVQLKDKRRTLAGRTGCGLCGTESLQHVVRDLEPVQTGQSICAQAIQTALEQFCEFQKLQSITGGAHAAAWVSYTGEVVYCEEDVGRHVALDKLIGCLAQNTVASQAGFCLVSSRASYEMVHKAASFGISLLVAVSAPTFLAIQLAEKLGVTLVGFARGKTWVAYTHTHRVKQEKSSQIQNLALEAL